MINANPISPRPGAWRGRRVKLAGAAGGGARLRRGGGAGRREPRFMIRRPTNGSATTAPRPTNIAPHKQVPPAFRPQVVTFRTAEQPGTIIIDGNAHFLYLVQPGQQAIRYGIGVGRDGFGWAGIVRVGRTAEWPTWTPPAEMVARDPHARQWANGQPGGPDNPLGARALYLYEGDQDTIYRIHGTPEPWTIGLDVSSGCIRMNNDDIIDLHSRIKVGAKVIVLMQGAALYKGV